MPNQDGKSLGSSAGTRWRDARRCREMSDFWVSLGTLVLLCLSAGMGRYLRPRLPETHRTQETVQTMQLMIGTLVTFAALVLGLLTASVKNSYDHAKRDRQAYALLLTDLDQCLRDYGPGSDPARADIASYTAAVIASTWPDEPPPKGVRYPNTAGMPVVGADPVLARVMDRAGQEIRHLSPTEPFRIKIADDCRATYRDVLQARRTVIEDARGSLSTPFYCILVFWLVVIFAAFGLAAPLNTVALIGILLCAVSLSSAVYVISDLSRPYRGLMSISSTDMRAALAHMLAP